MQELIQLAPALREAGVLKLGDGSKWAELAPAVPSAASGEKAEDEDESVEHPAFDPSIKLRAYDAPGDPKK